jgi:hypothetical protein
MYNRWDSTQDDRPSTSPIVYKRGPKYSGITELAIFSDRGLFLGSINVSILTRTRNGIPLIGDASLTDLDEGRIKLL